MPGPKLQPAEKEDVQQWTLEHLLGLISTGAIQEVMQTASQIIPLADLSTSPPPVVLRRFPSQRLQVAHSLAGWASVDAPHSVSRWTPDAGEGKCCLIIVVYGQSPQQQS